MTDKKPSAKKGDRLKPLVFNEAPEILIARALNTPPPPGGWRHTKSKKKRAKDAGGDRP